MNKVLLGKCVSLSQLPAQLEVFISYRLLVHPWYQGLL